MNIYDELSILCKLNGNNHNELNVSNKNQPERIPLRQRVADRKRGIKHEKPMSARAKKAMKLVVPALTAMQYLGLLMLVLSLGGIVTDNYEVKSVGLISFYCALFLVGRFGLMVIKSAGMFK